MSSVFDTNSESIEYFIVEFGADVFSWLQQDPNLYNIHND